MSGNEKVSRHDGSKDFLMHFEEQCKSFVPVTLNLTLGSLEPAPYRTALSFTAKLRPWTRAIRNSFGSLSACFGSFASSSLRWVASMAYTVG